MDEEGNKTNCKHLYGVGNTVYILANDDKKLIEVPLKESTELKIEKRDYTEPGVWEPKGFTNTIKLKLPRRLSRSLKRAKQHTERFRYQLSIAAQRPKHFCKISRCIRYGDSIPRKYARIYPDFIRGMQNLKKAGCLKVSCLVGTVCRRNDE